MLDRRRFLATIALPVGAAALGLSVALPRRGRAATLAADLAKHPGGPDDIARDEDFWFEVGRAFTVDRSLVNLNNGGVSPSPAFVQDAMKRHLDYSNTCPPHALWTILEPQREECARASRAGGASVPRKSRSRGMPPRAFRSASSAST